jgi:hypothetical protein
MSVPVGRLLETGVENISVGTGILVHDRQATGGLVKHLADLVQVQDTLLPQAGEQVIFD